MSLLFLWSVVGLAAPAETADCDTLASFYRKQLRARPADRPELWWLGEVACPLGSALAGSPPPEGEGLSLPAAS